MTDTTNPGPQPQKVTLTLPADAVEYLKGESERTGVSMADIWD